MILTSFLLFYWKIWKRRTKATRAEHLYVHPIKSLIHFFLTLVEKILCSLGYREENYSSYSFSRDTKIATRIIWQVKSCGNELHKFTHRTDYLYIRIHKTHEQWVYTAILQVTTTEDDYFSQVRLRIRIVTCYNRMKSNFLCFVMLLSGMGIFFSCSAYTFFFYLLQISWDSCFLFFRFVFTWLIRFPQPWNIRLSKIQNYISLQNG